MAKFNLKEHIAKNKSTFFGSLTEGQFSWMTQDTGQQIGSQDENKIPVYMFDDKGKYYYENDYDGYGVFGGKDYYELLDQMNGGIGDREEGIRKAFDAPAVAAGEVLFPALVTDPYKFNYKTHDFTQEAETDPNQSWYEPEEDEETDYGYGFGDMDREEDYDEEELEEGYDEFKRVEKGKKKTVAKDKGEEDVYGAGVKKGEEIEKKKMKISELKAKIKEMILAEVNLDIDNMEDAPESEVDFLAELEGMLNEAEGLTPLQDYVYQYEIEISGEDRAQDFLDDIKQLNTPDDVYNYYAYDRDWSGSMDDDLENIYRQVKRKFKNLSEADETEKDTAEVDTTDVAVDDTETVTTSTEVEVDPDVKAVQDALTQAQVAAQKLGDKKLTDQIGNTITFFTREHVVEKPKAAVAEGEESLEEALNKDIKTFAQDLGKRLTDAGFKVKYVNGTLSTEDMKQLKSSTGLVAFETDQNPSQQSLYLNFNPKEVNKIETIIDKFQLSPYNGKVMTKGWTSKQVQGAVNPGDIFKIDSDKLRGLIQFFRLAKVDTAVKSVNESMFPMLKKILK